MSKLSFFHPVYKLSARLWREVFKESLHLTRTPDFAARYADLAVERFEDSSVAHLVDRVGYDPCPFCGGEISVGLVRETSLIDDKKEEFRNAVHCRGLEAQSTGCGAQLTGRRKETEEELRKRWNTTTAARRYSRDP